MEKNTADRSKEYAGDHMQSGDKNAATDGIRDTLSAETLNDSIFTVPLRSLWHTWTDLFQSSYPALPQKTAMTMASLKPILKQVVLTEYQADDTVIIRLAGTGFEDIAGKPVTGLNALDLTPADQRSMVASAYSNMAAHKCGLYICERLEFERGADADLNTLVLPLDNLDQEAGFFIGVYDFGASRFAADGSPRQTTFRHKAFAQVSYIDLGFGTPTP